MKFIEPLNLRARSKSDSHLNKAKVICPIPIRPNDLAELNLLIELADGQDQRKGLNAGSRGNLTFIRKFSSLSDFELRSEL